MKMILTNKINIPFSLHNQCFNLAICKLTPRFALNIGFNFDLKTLLIRYNSTDIKSNQINYSNQNFIKTIIDPNIFIESRKIVGPVLESTFPNEFSPWFLTGFTEAEGNFDILLFLNSKALAQTSIKFRFRLSANYKDIVLLCAIKNFWGSGQISLIRKDTGVITMEISSIEVIKNKIIPFFEKYPLKGTKFYDYLNWKNSFKDFLENKDQLNTKLSLIERLKYAKSIHNRNKLEFKIPMEHLAIINPNYISGIVAGDGTFSLVTGPESFHKGFGRTILGITQHVNNKLLLEAILNYFSIGTVTSVTSKPNENTYVVSNKEDLKNKIRPFFEKYPLYGLHSISFLKWKFIIKYLLKLREEKSIFNRQNKPIIISNIRNIWLDKTSLLYNDLQIHSEEILKKMNELFKL
jgi:hypothetical protein